MNLQTEMAAVVANLESCEWTQGAGERPRGVGSAHGAVMACHDLRPGDAQIIRAVMRQCGLTEAWNDEPGRTKDQVVLALTAIEFSDANLAATFGPSWRRVVAVIRRMSVLTIDETIGLIVARDAVEGELRGAAWAAARSAAWSAGWSAALNPSGDSVEARAWAMAWEGAGDATGDAAGATALADLVGQHGLTQDHIDTLMQPWTAVLGEDWADGYLPEEHGDE